MWDREKKVEQYVRQKAVGSVYMREKESQSFVDLMVVPPVKVPGFPTIFQYSLSYTFEKINNL